MKTFVPPEMVAAYQATPQRMTLYDIADRLGKAPSTVWHALQEQNVDTTTYRKRLEERNLQVVEACKDERRTLKEVGQMFGITKQRVQQIVKRYHSARL